MSFSGKLSILISSAPVFDCLLQFFKFGFLFGWIIFQIFGSNLNSRVSSEVKSSNQIYSNISGLQKWRFKKIKLSNDRRVNLELWNDSNLKWFQIAVLPPSKFDCFRSFLKSNWKCFRLEANSSLSYTTFRPQEFSRTLTTWNLKHAEKSSRPWSEACRG